MKYFVTAIGTDCGKTVVSAVLCKIFKAAYWKPVQAGLEGKTDSEVVRELSDSPIIPEAYILNSHMSPHAAAERDGINIEVNTIIEKYRTIENENLIIEGAGGLMVPLNKDILVIDLIKELKIPVLLVVNFYLGSINHTLLSLEALQNWDIPVKGLIYTGVINQDSAKIIEKRSPWPILLKVPSFPTIHSEAIKSFAVNTNADVFH